MSELLSDIGKPVFGLMCVLILIHSYRVHFLFKKLKEVDPRERNRLRDGLLVIKWFLHEEYLRLNNQEIIKKARSCRTSQIVIIVSIIVYCMLYGIILPWLAPHAAL